MGGPGTFYVGASQLRTLRLGVKSLLLHKLRSVLAVLGILIGVTAVIWLVAMGEGVSYQAQQQINELGAKNIILRSVKPAGKSSMQSGLFVTYGLLRSDFKRIVATIPTVADVTPTRELIKEVRRLQNIADARIVGCTPKYLAMSHLRMADGRFLTYADAACRDNVCALSGELAQILFGNQSPLEKTIQVGKDFYVVVGVTQQHAALPSAAGIGQVQHYDNDVYIPMATLQARIGDRVMTSKSGSIEAEAVELSQLTVTVDDVSHVETTAAAIRSLLKQSHKNLDYAVLVPQELLRQAKVFQTMFRVLSVVVAGISLLVGGIGIMNIMLATVTERTREIGIRRALGAKRADIIHQFLSETIALSGIGGILGVGLGLSCGPGIRLIRVALVQAFPNFINQLPPAIQRLEPRISTWSIGAAFAIAVLIGILFGMYPAMRAARMDPIEALRHE